MSLEGSSAARFGLRSDLASSVEAASEGPGGEAHNHLISLSSNDYLGLSRHPGVIAAAQGALSEYGFGSSATRAVAGNRRIFEDLERLIAEFKQVDTTLVFQSGYTANLGMIPALIGPRDLLLHDELNHASCGDGARLSGAIVRAYRHRDVGDLEGILSRRRRRKSRLRERIVIVTDGVFGMEGDIAPLPDICAVADRYGASVIVDDAHATGVLGRNGRGSVDYFGLQGRIEVQVGTLSKALGAVGGYVGASERVRDRLSTICHPILYSSLPPAAVAAAAIAALGILEAEPSRVERLWSNTRFMKSRLLAAGFDMGESQTPIIPLYMATPEMALTFASRLRDRGVMAQAATPRRTEGTRSRLRLIVRSDLSENDLVTCADAIEELGRELRDAGRQPSVPMV